MVLVRPDGSVRQVADGLRWPNGMALVDDGRTLVVADSHAEQLVGFDVAADGTLAGRGVWAEVEQAPDGICADADGAIWFASVPGRQCVRVARSGEVLDTVDAGQACFACMLGGHDGRTLFMATAEWRGMDVLTSEGPGRTGRLLAAPGQPAPHAGRPSPLRRRATVAWSTQNDRPLAYSSGRERRLAVRKQRPPDMTPARSVVLRAGGRVSR